VQVRPAKWQFCACCTAKYAQMCRLAVRSGEVAHLCTLPARGGRFVHGPGSRWQFRDDSPARWHICARSRLEVAGSSTLPTRGGNFGTIPPRGGTFVRFSARIPHVTATSARRAHAVATSPGPPPDRPRRRRDASCHHEVPESYRATLGGAYPKERRFPLFGGGSMQEGRTELRHLSSLRCEPTSGATSPDFCGTSRPSTSAGSASVLRCDPDAVPVWIGREEGASETCVAGFLQDRDALRLPTLEDLVHPVRATIDGKADLAGSGDFG
jgi:hypothetical protein